MEEESPLEDVCAELLASINHEDPQRDGLRDTPMRFARAIADLTQGYSKTSKAVVKDAIFKSTEEGIVVMKDIPIYSLCEHHLIFPFWGKAHVAYYPNPDKGIIGLSKIHRVVETVSRRLQAQERLTQEIMTSFEELLQPRGVAVILECRHMCIEMLHIDSSVTITSSTSGIFCDPARLSEFTLLVLQKDGISIGKGPCCCVEEALEPSTSAAADIVAPAHGPMTIEISRLQQAGTNLLANIQLGDPQRDGLQDAPANFAFLFDLLTKGYSKTAAQVVQDAIFKSTEQDIVICCAPVYSLCEHHLLPFWGKAHIAYYPNSEKGVLGRDNVQSLVEVFSRRLQVQERLTHQIMVAFEELLQPRGVAVILECRHMCIEMRGVNTESSTTITTSRSGMFHNSATFKEFVRVALMKEDIPNMQHPCCGSNASESAGGAAGSLRMLGGTEVHLDTLPHVSEGDLYRMHQSRAGDESLEIARLVRKSLLGPSLYRSSGFSMLDIGAGNGDLLERFHLSSDDGPLLRYTAFEADQDLYQDLARKAREASCSSSIACKVFPSLFSVDISNEEVGGPFDVVLFSHSLYGHKSKETSVEHALRFVAPGGLLIVVHRWKPGGTLHKLCNHFEGLSMLYNLTVWDTVLNMEGASDTERRLLARYCDARVSMLSGPSYKHKIGCITVEPHGASYGDGTFVEAVIARTKERVGYMARKKKPAFVVRPNTTAGVQACVRAAAKKTLGCDGLTCIGGGHSAHCLGEQALVVDMGEWNRVVVDVEQRRVRVGGGATIGEITKQCEKHGLVVPLGDRPSVGVGLILQGGLNHLMRQFGLATDSIQAITYVSPSAHVKNISDTDGLFVFRGAGSNFGVVLELELCLYQLCHVEASDMVYPLPPSDGFDTVLIYSDMACSASKEECLDGFMFWSKHDTLSFATSYFSVDARRGGSPLLDDSGKEWSSLAKFLPSELFDRELYMTPLFAPSATAAPGLIVPTKLRSSKKCLMLPKITGELAHLLLDAVKNAPTKWCYFHFLHGGGVVRKVETTAFGCRDWEFAVVLTGRWPDSDTVLYGKVSQWLEDVVARLLPHSSGVYSADLGAKDGTLAAHAFGPNYANLVELKKVDDPLNLFRHGCPLSWERSNPPVSDPGIVVVLCGRRCVGKDWLAVVARTRLRVLLSNGPLVQVASISDSIKKEYTEFDPTVNLDRLLSDREYKESHRGSLSAFYESKKLESIDYDARCYVKTIQESSGKILFLTGIRDGLEYARRLAGRPVVLVKIVASEEIKRSRGWRFSESVDGSESEFACDCPDDSFWDAIYENHGDEDKASTWVESVLVPLILKECVRNVADTPRKGVIFRDLIGGLLLQPFALSLCTALVVNWINAQDTLDAILSPEALGWVFAAPVACALGKPLVLMRKEGSLPGVEAQRVHYQGSNMQKLTSQDDFSSSSCGLEVVVGALRPGQRVGIVDDCLASGETLEAVIRLVKSAGAIPVLAAFVMELPDLGGRQHFSNVQLFSIVQFPGE